MNTYSYEHAFLIFTQARMVQLPLYISGSDPDNTVLHRNPPRGSIASTEAEKDFKSIAIISLMEST